jgi:hypothetical protein
MGLFFMMLLSPFRFLASLLGIGTKLARSRGAAVASGIGDTLERRQLQEEENEWADYARSLMAGHGFGPLGFMLFDEFRRPDADEMRPQDLDFEAGKSLAREATRFFSNPIDIFESPGSWLYEQVEREFIRRTYSGEGSQSDRKFIFTMRRFRKLVNANTAKMFLLHVPVTAIAAGMASHFALTHLSTQMVVTGLPPWLPLGWNNLSVVGIVLVSLVYIAFLFNIFYRNAQQNSARELDNYIETKFGRIVQNFKEAEKKGIDEQNRGGDPAEIAERAAVWVTCYTWFGFRMFLNEHILRNVMFQILRNTRFYQAAVYLILIYFALLLPIQMFAGAWNFSDLGFADAAGQVWQNMVPFLPVVIIWFAAYALILRYPTRFITERVRDTEWSRFHTIGMGRALFEQVQRDKTEIVRLREQYKPSGR